MTVNPEANRANTKASDAGAVGMMVQEGPLIIAIGVVTMAVTGAEKLLIRRMGFLPADSVQAAASSLTA